MGGMALAGAAIPGDVYAEERLLVHGANPQNLATPTEYFDRLETPTSVFFVRSHFGPPALKRERKLEIAGLVKKPVVFGVDDLSRFTELSVTAVLQCAGNGRALHEPRVPGVQWVHGAMGQAMWTGVRLSDLLDAAGVTTGAAHVRLRAADLPPKPAVPAFDRSLPMARALDPTTLVAYRMNGKPLSLSHGAPLRLVVPGWAGNHWMKWLTRIEPHAEEIDGFFMKKGYRLPKDPVAPGSSVPPEATVPVTTFPVKSVIARPVEGGTVPARALEIVGVAFSGTGAIARVEVRIDDGPWAEAKLEGAAGPGRWQVFRHRLDASPGQRRAAVRATETGGATQPEKPAWNPSGYFWNGWHSVTFTVAS